MTEGTMHDDPTAGSKSSQMWAIAARKAVFILLLILGVYLRMNQFEMPWTTDFRGQCGSFYANIARNYVNFGYCAMKFAPVYSVNPESSGDFLYYCNHPPLLQWLVGLSFKIFGIHEWSARLVPLIFSSLTMILLYLLVRLVWNEDVALCTLAAFCFLPMGVFYGMLVDVQGPLPLFFVMLVLYLYCRFSERPARSTLALMFIAFVIGMLTDWPVYYLSVLLPVYHLLKRRPHRLSVCMMFPVALVMLAGFVLYANWVETGRVAMDLGLLQYLTVTRAGPHASSVVVTLASLVSTTWVTFFTVPALLMLVGWVIAIPGMRLLRKGHADDWMLWFLFAFGLIHVLLFSYAALAHFYWSYYMLPSVAIACGLTMYRGGLLMARLVRVPRIVVSILIIALLIVTSQVILKSLYNGCSDIDYALMGHYMGKHCDGRSSILTNFDGHTLMHYYLRNPMFCGLINRTNVTLLRWNPRARYIFLTGPDDGPGLSSFRRNLVQYMKQHHPDKITFFPLAKLLDVKDTDLFDYLDTLDTIEPPTIEDVEIDGHSVRLRWSHSNPGNVALYRLFMRRDGVPFYWFSIGSVKGKSEIVVKNPGCQPLWIVVVAVDGRGEESGFEREVKGWRPQDIGGH